MTNEELDAEFIRIKEAIVFALEDKKIRGIDTTIAIPALITVLLGMVYMMSNADEADTRKFMQEAVDAGLKDVIKSGLGSRLTAEGGRKGIMKTFSQVEPKQKKETENG